MYGWMDRCIDVFMDRLIDELATNMGTLEVPNSEGKPLGSGWVGKSNNKFL